MIRSKEITLGKSNAFIAVVDANSGPPKGMMDARMTDDPCVKHSFSHGASGNHRIFASPLVDLPGSAPGSNPTIPRRVYHHSRVSGILKIVQMGQKSKGCRGVGLSGCRGK
jgi:hypothetical protein